MILTTIKATKHRVDEDGQRRKKAISLEEERRRGGEKGKRNIISKANLIKKF